MSSTVLKWSIAVLIISGAILLWLSLQLASQTSDVDTPDPGADEALVLEPGKKVVVAVSAIEADEVIEPEDISVERAGVVPESGFTAAEEVIGRRVPYGIGVGEPILERHFRDPGVMASNVPEGKRAMAISVNDVTNVAGFVEPGDRVDLVVFLSQDQEVSASQARVLLSDVSVLAFGQNSVETTGEGDGGPDPDVTTAVLAVPEEQVPRVMLGVSSGRVSLTLRGSAEARSDQASAGASGDEGTNLGELASEQGSRETLSSLSGQRAPDPASRTRVHRGSETEEIIH